MFIDYLNNNKFLNGCSNVELLGPAFPKDRPEERQACPIDGCPSGSQFNRTVHIKYHKEFVHIYYCFVGFIW